MSWTVRAPRICQNLARLAALGALLFGAEACVDPQFADDASAPRDDASELLEPDASRQTCAAGTCPTAADTGPDADSPIDGGDDTDANVGDEVQKLWIGRYAARTAMYSVDGILQGSAQMLTLIEIKRSGSGLVLEEQLCKFDGGWNAFIVDSNLRFIYPPIVRSSQLTYDAQGFSSATNVFTFGYGAAPAGCASATSLALSPQPAWLTGNCQCVQGGGPPSDKRDCRVLDPEGDGAPGATFNVLISGSPWLYYAVQEERIRYLDGYRQGKNLYASQEALDNTKVLGCAGPPGGDCTIGSAIPCPPKYNRSEFIPVLPNFDCARIIQQEAGLFPNPIGVFPAGCPADLNSK